MSSCPNCGHPSRSTDVFCQNCGAALNAPPAGKAPAFCTNCGEQLNPSAAFCANCGAPVNREPAPQAPPAPKDPRPAGAPARGKRRLLIGAIAGAAAVAAAVIAVLVVPSLLTTPAQKFVSCQQDLFLDRALAVVEEGVDTLGTGKFSSDLTITASIDNDGINEYLEDSSIGLKLELDQDSLMADAEVNLMGSPILSGFLTYDQGRLGFYLPEIQNTYYTMDLSQTIETLSGQQVDLSVLTLPQISGKEWRSLLQSYLDVVYTVVNQENVTAEQNVSFYLPYLGDSVTGTRYTFRPWAEDVEAMLRKLAQTLREDETLRQLLLKLINPDMLTAAFGTEIFDGYDLEAELDDALLSLADELEDSAADAGREVEESGFTWELCLEGNDVRMIRLYTTQSDDMIVYEARGRESDGRQEVFYVTAYEEIQFALTHDYTKNGSRSQGSVSAIPYYGSAVRLDYDMDPEQKSSLGISKGSYRLTAEDEGFTFSLDVSDTGNGSVDHTFVIQADPYYYFNGMFSRVEININATQQSSVEAPSAPPVDISRYSYGEYQALFEDLGRAVYEDLVRNLEPLIYSSYGW